MMTFTTIIHISACAFLVLLVLIQSGKGAEISASFGGSSQTVFGSSGGANLFARATGVLAGIFMITSLYLTVHGSAQSRTSIFDRTAGAPAAASSVPAGQATQPAAAAKSEPTSNSVPAATPSSK